MDQQRRTTIQVAKAKVVYIGNRPPTDHYAPAAKRFVHAEELYQPKNRHQRDR